MVCPLLALPICVNRWFHIHRDSSVQLPWPYLVHPQFPKFILPPPSPHLGSCVLFPTPAVRLKAYCRRRSQHQHQEAHCAPEMPQYSPGQTPKSLGGPKKPRGNSQQFSANSQDKPRAQLDAVNWICARKNPFVSHAGSHKEPKPSSWFWRRTVDSWILKSASLLETIGRPTSNYPTPIRVEAHRTTQQSRLHSHRTKSNILASPQSSVSACLQHFWQHLREWHCLCNCYGTRRSQSGNLTRWAYDEGLLRIESLSAWI